MQEAGRNNVEAATHAKDQAFLHGLRMCALAGNIWPLQGDGVLRVVSEELLTELMAFSIHTRRFMEMLRMKKGAVTADGPLVKIQSQEHPYENDVWTAVNRVLHSSEMKVTTVQVETSKHSNLGDMLIANVLITSPERNKVSVCPQGIFYGFAVGPDGWKMQQ